MDPDYRFSGKLFFGGSFFGPSTTADSPNPRRKPTKAEKEQAKKQRQTARASRKRNRH